MNGDIRPSGGPAGTRGSHLPPSKPVIMWVRIAIAGALFIAGAVTGTMPALAHVDRAITLWVQRAAPALDTPTAMIVFLGNAGTVIPALGAIGLLLLLIELKRYGRAALWLSIGAAAISGLTVVLQNVIVHPGPPDSLKRHFIRAPDAPFAVLSALGVTHIVVIGLVGVALWLLLLAEPRRDRALLLLASAGAGFGVLALIFRELLHAASFGQMLEWVDIAPFGFPSGHVARVGLIAGTALRRIPGLAIGIIIALMASLVYLGDHWTSEVVGGLCLGWVGAELTSRLWEWLG
jgi:membrane-associated phospholipid phosphatase